MPAIVGNPKIKGGVLLSRLQFLRKRFGQAGLEKVLARLPADDRAALTGIVIPISWYPFELNLRLDEAIAAEAPRSEQGRIFLELGVASAETNLLSNHAVFVHKGDPHHLLARAAQIYRLYYDKGRRVYEKLGDTHAQLRTYDAENVTATDCQTVVGWHQRAIEMCGGQEVHIAETRCRTRGDDYCEYDCRWS
jgi:uncharacterized protein (TIGR02265 family)